MLKKSESYNLTHEKLAITIALEKYKSGFKNPKDKYYISECIVNTLTDNENMTEYCRIYNLKCSKIVSFNSNEMWLSIEGILSILFGENGVTRLQTILHESEATQC